ncbi:hypothetical protein [Actinomadura keratinilytica]|uniref:Transposase n=1 Tax=Actinomadura keratinilytica TaxID=547461 RepID=A0ABP7ZCP8_9ACTN
MARRDPRDKKRISYANNRRNAYAENDKSSRNAVRLNKRFPHRADRHRVQWILRDAVGAPADGAADEVEERLGRRRPKSWRKHPDLPLGDWAEIRLERRLELEPGSPANERRLARVRQSRRRRAGLRTLRTAEIATKGTVERNW